MIDLIVQIIISVVGGCIIFFVTRYFTREMKEIKLPHLTRNVKKSSNIYYQKKDIYGDLEEVILDQKEKSYYLFKISYRFDSFCSQLTPICISYGKKNPKSLKKLERLCKQVNRIKKRNNK